MFDLLRRSPFRDGRQVIFCHVQKTGGTSLRQALATAIRHRRVYPTRQEMSSRGLTMEFEAELYGKLSPAARSKIWLIADHLPPYLFENEPGDPLFVTMLREPVARAISHLAHVRRWWPGFEKRSLMEMIDYPPLRKGIIENLQIRFFSANTVAQATYQFLPRPIDRDDLARALQRIEEMHAVGLTDRFAASIQLIGQAVGMPHLAEQRENVRSSQDYEGADDPRLRERVADAVELDREFYAVVKSSVDAKLDAAAIKTMRYDR